MSQSCECPPGAGASTCELRPAPGPVLCPTNGQPGKRIDTLTLKALLALPLTAISSDQYMFCRDPDCPTVYYSADGSQLFSEEHLRELVFQKHPGCDDVFVCYCFRHRSAAYDYRSSAPARLPSSSPSMTASRPESAPARSAIPKEAAASGMSEFSSGSCRKIPPSLPAFGLSNSRPICPR